MTRPSDPSDPRRALDGVAPPDAWDEVVARADCPPIAELVPTDPTRSRRPLLLAASVVLVIGLVGALGVAARDDDQSQHVEASQTELDPPSEIWGRTWKVTRMSEGSRDRDPSADGQGTPIELDLGRFGLVSYRVCSSGQIGVKLDGSRLGFQGELVTASGCGSPGGEQQGWLGSFFRSEPTVELRGDRLTLRTARASMELEDVTTTDDPSSMWGREWGLDGIAVGGELRTVVRRRGGQPYVLDARSEGGLRFEGEGCNYISGSGRLDDDYLEGDHLEGDHLESGIVAATQRACERRDLAQAEALMTQDHLVARVLAGDPKVTVRGRYLYLATETVQVAFVDVDPVPNRPSGETTTSAPGPETTATTTAAPITPSAPSTTATSAPLTTPSTTTPASAPTATTVIEAPLGSGDVPCSFTFLPAGPSDPLIEVVRSLADGPLDPPIYGQRQADTDGFMIKHGKIGDQSVEVSVPGQVVIDLVGERTEQVVLARTAREATVWLTTGWVQVRTFGGNGPCPSFTVTARGGSEQENQELAVSLADGIEPEDK